jgi:hypothetical protein
MDWIVFQYVANLDHVHRPSPATINHLITTCQIPPQRMAEPQLKSVLQKTRDKYSYMLVGEAKASQYALCRDLPGLIGNK